jgi:hypothetical protein
MIRRYILHIELHKGYKPCVSIKRAPYHGQRVKNGNFPGTLKACPTCSGEGYLHELDNMPTIVKPKGPSS